MIPTLWEPYFSLQEKIDFYIERSENKTMMIIQFIETIAQFTLFLFLYTSLLIFLVECKDSIGYVYSRNKI